MSLPSLLRYLIWRARKKFGSKNQRADIAPRLEGDSHKHVHVNFFKPRVNTMSSGFVSSNVDVGQSNGIVKDEAFVLTFQGLKVQKLVCGDGVWRIERCAPSSNIHCFTIQRDSMKHCDAIIIAKKIVCGIPSPYYDGLWSNLKRFAPICHKFQFFVDDLIQCARGIGRKYCVDRPLVPSMWPVQIETDLTQFEVTTLEEA